ncbi:hypothetical protein SEVIR_1G043900v4 [Setaria viridis]|uniref:Uncharacterized protein n=2 Tax=Setaria TaxID=4554 RepID=K3YWY4_SETIT|nr:hypothetical protein SETIT_1G044400v2 [Setaria italica]TKW37389.1 hypothetical protein SEVIR_1G043900v2 [Setaria viridis]
MAGLGVLIDLRTTIHSCRLQVLGMARVDSVLMAELAAILLAAKILSVLHVQSGGIGADCLLAVRNIQSLFLKAPWKLRPWISQIQQDGLQELCRSSKFQDTRTLKQA